MSSIGIINCATCPSNECHDNALSKCVPLDCGNPNLVAKNSNHFCV